MQKIASSLLVLLLLSLSACASQASASKDLNSTESATQIASLVSQELTAVAPPTATITPTLATTTRLSTDYENAVSVEMQLLLGIFKLEGTGNAVTGEQAKTLEPLWTNFKTISQSLMPTGGKSGQGQPNAAPQAVTVDAQTRAQIETLTSQIQAALTLEQIKAIAELKITQETAKSILQEQGITLGGPQANGGGGGQIPQGTPPAGGPDGGGQPPADGQQPGNGQMSTPQAGRMRGGLEFPPTELIEALLKLLQSKVG